MMKYERSQSVSFKKVMALMLCMVMAVMMLTSCGGDKTLESYVADNSEIQQQIDSVADSAGMKIEVKDNTLTYIYKYDTTYDDATVEVMKDTMTTYLDNAESTFKSLADQLEDESKIDGITIKVVYQNGDGSTITEREYQ